MIVFFFVVKKFGVFLLMLLLLFMMKYCSLDELDEVVEKLCLYWIVVEFCNCDWVEGVWLVVMLDYFCMCGLVWVVFDLLWIDLLKLLLVIDEVINLVVVYMWLYGWNLNYFLGENVKDKYWYVYMERDLKEIVVCI